jgi:hypothetical protein
MLVKNKYYKTNNQTFKNDYQTFYHIYVKESNNLVYGRKYDGRRSRRV